MRKIFLALLIIFCVNNCAFADNLKIGILTHQNMSSEEFADFIKSQERSFFGWKILNTSHSLNDEFIYFDSLTSMLMALQSGKIDEAALPEAVAEYIVNTNPAFTFACAHRSRNTHLAIGFRDDEAGRRLQQKVNEALAGMKADLTLRTCFHNDIIVNYEKDRRQKTTSVSERSHRCSVGSYKASLLEYEGI